MKVDSIGVSQYRIITNKKQGVIQYTDIPKVSFKSDNRSSLDYNNGFFTIDTSPKADLAIASEKDAPVSDKITSEAQPYTSIFSKYPKKIPAAPKITYDRKEVERNQTSPRYGEKEVKYYNGDKLVLDEYYAGPLFNGFSSCNLSLRSAVYYEPDGKTVKEKRSYGYELWTGMERGTEIIEKYKDGEFDVKLQYKFWSSGSGLNYAKDRFSEVRINEKNYEEWCMKYDQDGNKVLGVVYDLGSERVLCEHKYEKDGSYCTVRYNPKNGVKISEQFFNKYDRMQREITYNPETGEQISAKDIKYDADVLAEYDSKKLPAAPDCPYTREECDKQYLSDRYGQKEIKYYDGDTLVKKEIYKGPLLNGFFEHNLSIRFVEYYEPDGATVKEQRSWDYELWSGMERGVINIDKYNNGEHELSLSYNFDDSGYYLKRVEKDGRTYQKGNTQEYENGQLIHETEFDMNRIKREKFYNDKQQLAHEIEYEYDSEYGLNRIEKETFYDDRHKIAKEVYYCYDGNVNIPTSTTVKLYKDDTIVGNIHFRDIKRDCGDKWSSIQRELKKDGIKFDNKCLELATSEYLSDIADCCKNPNNRLVSEKIKVASHTMLNKKYDIFTGEIESHSTTKIYDTDKEKSPLFTKVCIALAAIPVLFKTKLPHKAKSVIKY